MGNLEVFLEEAALSWDLKGEKQPAGLRREDKEHASQKERRYTKHMQETEDNLVLLELRVGQALGIVETLIQENLESYKILIRIL